MAIKARVTSGEFEQLNPALKEHYKRGEDGSYVIDAPDVEDVFAQPLKRALQTERTERGKLEDLATKLRTEVDRFKDIDPERAREALKTLEQIDDKKLLDEGKVDDIVVKRTEKMRLDYEAREKNLASQIAEREKANADLVQRLERTMVDQGITLAATKANVRSGALGDVIRRARETWRLEGDKALPYRDGAIVYGKNAQEPMTMEEWVVSLSLSDDGKHLFEPSKGTGTVPGQRSINGTSVLVLSREEARNPARYREAQEQASKSGLQLQIAAE